MIDAKRKPGKTFTESDVKLWSRDANIIMCERDDLIWNPPAWMRQGRQETASGYGRRLNSGYLIRFNRRIYRLYVTIFSNNGTMWFKAGGRQIIVNAN
jgi:hypothetical protein